MILPVHQTRPFKCASHPLPSSAHVLKAHDFLILCHLHHGRKEEWHHLWTLGICVPVVIIDYRGKMMYSTAERTTSLSIHRPLFFTNMHRVTSLKTKAGCYWSDTDRLRRGYSQVYFMTRHLCVTAARCIAHIAWSCWTAVSTDTEESSAILAAL